MTTSAAFGSCFSCMVILRGAPVIVLPVDLLYDRKKKSEPPVQNCCTFRVMEDCLRYRNFPAIFRQFSGNFPAIFPQFFDPFPRPQPPPPGVSWTGGP